MFDNRLVYVIMKGKEREMDSKKWEAPEELVTMMVKADALDSICSLYVKLPFGYKKALKTSIESHELRDAFWVKIYKLYPDCKGKGLSFYKNERVIREKVI